MVRRKLYLATVAALVAFISACADATGPTPSHDCQMNAGTGTCINASR